MVRPTRDPVIKASKELPRIEDVLFLYKKELTPPAEPKTHEELEAFQLRSPLTKIRWALNRFIRSSTALSAEEKRLLLEAKRASERLAETIHAMLIVSRLESGSMHIRSGDVHVLDLLEELRREMHHAIAERKHTCQVLCPAGLHALTDRRLLKEVLRTLLDNAVKYTMPGGTIEMRASHEDGATLLVLSDTGIGIPTREQPRVFQKFFRADNAMSLVADGNGLGLYMIHGIVGLLGGSIEFSSREHVGTTFRLRFGPPSPVPSPSPL